MAHKCSSCGTRLFAGSNFCHECGKEIEITVFKKKEEDSEKESKQAPVSGFTQPLAPNVAAFLCYLICVLAPIFLLTLEPYQHDRFVRFHAWQSIYFFAAWIGFQVLSGILFWGLLFLWFLSPLFHTAFVAIWILLMVKAYKGEKFMLPILGALAEKKADEQKA